MTWLLKFCFEIVRQFSVSLPIKRNNKFYRLIFANEVPLTQEMLFGVTYCVVPRMLSFETNTNFT